MLATQPIARAFDIQLDPRWEIQKICFLIAEFTSLFTQEITVRQFITQRCTVDRVTPL